MRSFLNSNLHSSFNSNLYSTGIASRVVSRLVPLLAIGVMSLSPLVSLRPAFAQEVPMRTILVSGQGVEAIPTTLTQVQLGVEAQGSTPVAVQQEVAQRSSAIVDLLQSRKVSKLQTTGITLSPIYDYSDNQQRLVGYSATNTVSFQGETNLVGALLDDTVKAGASRIDSISFVASDEAIERARQQALQEATLDAQTQADTILRTLGLVRRDVIEINVNNSYATPAPYFRAVATMDAAGQASTPIVGGEQQVDASVTIRFSY